MIKMIRHLLCKLECFGMEVGMARAAAGFNRMGKSKNAKQLIESLKGSCKCNA